ncbi:MAG: hypothetical protein LBJ61_08145 [Deltaproteobacteria bacterium]|nr:hypothetical protein [Deltaproteobacteria bacterium]
MAQANLTQAEYTEKEIGSWFALFDDTKPGVPATAFVAKSSFTRHLTKVALDDTTMHVGCDGTKNFIFFDFDVPLKSEAKEKSNVSYQFDEGKFTNAKWNLSTNGKAFMVPNPEKFIKNLLTVKLLLVKVVNAQTSEEINSYFNISDLPEAFQFVRENCPWK